MREGVSASAVALPAGPWPLVLDFLAQRLPVVTQTEWAQRMARGDVLDGRGQPLPPGAAYRAGERIYYYRTLDHEPAVPFEESVVHQDEWLVVADKPHFLPVTPKGRYVQQTLLTRLKKRLGIEALVPVHRIDRETAGLVLFSVRPQDRDAYQRLFRERTVEKIYEAVAPTPERSGQDLTLPMFRRSRLVECNEAFMQMHEVPGEANAETEIRLVERRDALARYELRPLTGRKHQLRAQMSALGLPLVGDRIYPVLQAVQAEPDYAAPLQLLARELAFVDPITGAPRRFKSALRLDF